MSDIPTVTYYAYSGTRYVGQFSGEDSAVLAFIAGKGYTTGPKPIASDRDLWVSIVSQATAAQEAAEDAQAAIEAALAELDFTADDRAKIDSIETGADVTDTANVTAAGALMDSEVTNLADVKAFDPTDYQPALAEGDFADGDKTKLDGIEAAATADQTGSEIKAAYEAEADTNAYTDTEKSKLAGIEASADVTDTANVTAAGALMDSEVTNLAAVKAFDPADYVEPGDDADTLGSGAATDGQVLTADGAGGAAWEDAGGGGGGLVPLSTSVISSTVSSVSVSLSGYTAYQIHFEKMLPDGSSILCMRISDDGGSTFETGSIYVWNITSVSGGTNTSQAAAPTLVRLSGTVSSTASNGGLDGSITITPGEAGTNSTKWAGMTYRSSFSEIFAGREIDQLAVDTLQIFFDGDDIVSGKITVYGLAEA